MAERKPKRRDAQTGENAATRILTIRMRPNDYEAIKREAEAQNRSISAQAEQRLLQPNVGELGLLVDRVVAQQEEFAGKSWREDADVRMKVRGAIEVVLTVMLGVNKYGHDLLKRLDDETERKKSELKDSFGLVDAIIALDEAKEPVEHYRALAQFAEDFLDAVALRKGSDFLARLLNREKAQ